MFEERGYLNLIKENKIKTTRNFHAWRQAREMVADGYRFYGEQKCVGAKAGNGGASGECFVRMQNADNRRQKNIID